MKSIFKSLVILTGSTFLLGNCVTAQSTHVFVEAEGDLILNQRTNLNSAPESATRFDLASDFQRSTKTLYRINAGVTFGKSGRNTLAAAIVPFKFKYDGIVPFSIDYQGQTFDKGDKVESSFEFSTYRLAYRYAVINRPKLRLETGITAAFRVADLIINNGSVRATNSNRLVLPLASIDFNYRFTKSISLLAASDLVFIKNARVDDSSVGFGFLISPNLRLGVNYRFYDAFADDKTSGNFYSFTQVSAGTVALRLIL